MNLYRAIAAAVLAGCGLACGASATSPQTQTQTVSITATGATRQTGVNSCDGDVHAFTAAAGDISVRLSSTSDPNAALSVQVCSGSTDTGSNCAIKQQKIAVGQTLTGARVGTAAQTLKFLPFACVFANTYDPTPITYSASVTYQQ